MYEVNVENRVFDIVDLYEINNLLTKNAVEKDLYYEGLKDEIKEFYSNIFKEMDREESLKSVINYQLLIDNAYDYLLNGKGDFEKYFEKSLIKKPEIDKIYKKIDSGEKLTNKTCFNPKEILDNLKNMEDDPMSFFYYLSFTVFFLEKYLLHSIVMFPKIFMKKSFTKNGIEELYSYMVRIYSDDFSEGFKRFEEEMKTNYEN